MELGVERSVIDHWIPPKPESGWIEGVGILIPFSHLRKSEESLPQPIVQLPSSRACNGYSVRFLLEAPGAKGIAFPPGLPVGVFDRCTGGRLYVLAAPVDLKPKQFEAFEVMCAEARAGRSDELTYPTERFVGVARIQTQRILVDLTIA